MMWVKVQGTYFPPPHFFSIPFHLHSSLNAKHAFPVLNRQRVVVRGPPPSYSPIFPRRHLHNGTHVHRMVEFPESSRHKISIYLARTYGCILFQNVRTFRRGD